MMKKEQKFTSEEQRFLTDLGDRIDDPDMVSNFIESCYENYFKMMPDGEYKKNILTKIYRNYLNRDLEEGHRKVKITTTHIEFLQKLPNDLLKRLFYSLIVRAEVKPHASGWISLGFENTVKYGLSPKDAKKAKIEIYSQCTDYGFNCRVSGSTKPTLCFQLPEMKDGSIVYEFEDGEALKMYENVVSYKLNKEAV